MSDTIDRLNCLWRLDNIVEHEIKRGRFGAVELSFR